MRRIPALLSAVVGLVAALLIATPAEAATYSVTLNNLAVYDADLGQVAQTGGSGDAEGHGVLVRTGHGERAAALPRPGGGQLGDVEASDGSERRGASEMDGTAHAGCTLHEGLRTHPRGIRTALNKHLYGIVLHSFAPVNDPSERPDLTSHLSARFREPRKLGTGPERVRKITRIS